MKTHDLKTIALDVDRLFKGSRGSGTAPLTRNDGGEELLQGALYRFRMWNEVLQQPVLLHFYSGLANVVGHLWEQEARALLHLSYLQHPGLPRVVEGGFFESEGVGYIVTVSAKYNLATRGVLEKFLEPPNGKNRALRQLLVLTDALAKMHAKGLMHRAIGPAAIEVVTEWRPNGDGMDLRFSRFEMSALVSSLARRVSTIQPLEIERIRQFYLRSGLQTLLCCPPERLAYLYPTSTPGTRRDNYEEANSDVYGLGVLAYQWLFETIPEARLASIFSAGACDQQQLSTLMAQMRQRLRKPGNGALADLLLWTLDPNRRQRATSAEMLACLSELASTESAAFPGLGEERPFVLSVSARDFEGTRLAQTFLQRSPSTDEGWHELREVLRRDLQGALLSYSEDGFKPFRRATDPDLANAKYVLRGQSFAYFARPFLRRDPEDPYSGSPVEEPRALQVRYVLDLSLPSARLLDQQLHKRRISRVEIQRFEALEEKDLSTYPSWEPHMQAVAVERGTPEWQPMFEEALLFMVAIDRVRLHARRYPFRRHPNTPGNQQFVRLLLDDERDQKYLDKNSLLLLFASISGNRPSFGDFFEHLDLAHKDGIMYSEHFEGPRNDRRGSGFFKQRLNPGEIEIQRRPDAPPVPETGWLQSVEDSGMHDAHDRQRWALTELLANTQLLGQLHEPKALMRLRVAGPEAGAGLIGNAGQIVQDMLNFVPFYAVHGPPGTGKTKVTASAVQWALRHDRSQRILISAQSHDSLDNIAMRILGSFGKGEVSAVRVASGSAEEKVHEDVAPYLPQRQAESLVGEIVKHCDDQLAARWVPTTISDLAEDDPDRAAATATLRRVLGEWHAHAGASILEIKDRLRRGANLVFATCLTATTRYLAAEGDRDLFDWVIVEEAAKAWPTELAIPLVRGMKWTLIGDHRQLPAFGRKEMEQFLGACQGNKDDNIAQHWKNREAYIEVFDLFRNLFKPLEDGTKAAPADPSSPLQIPLGKLERQFRMRKPIAELVRKLFYGVLETDPITDVDHGLEQPGALAGKILVWCDTQHVNDCGEEFGWKNVGEARVVYNLLTQLHPNPLATTHPPPNEHLVVLTPYNDQRTELRRILPPHEHEYVHTIDSFQGREAEIVVVSLVRENSALTAAGRLGHLIDPRRVNVMLSRARRLLVLVGNLSHFEQAGDKVWTELIVQLKILGHVLPAHDLMDRPERQEWAAAFPAAGLLRNPKNEDIR